MLERAESCGFLRVICTTLLRLLLLTVQMSSGAEDTCPATVLVQLALQKWAECSLRADNISVMVLLFNNCKYLDSSALQYSFSCESDRLPDSIRSLSSVLISNSNSIDVDPVKKRRHKAHCHKKSASRKPLALINDTRSNKCRSAKRHKHKFKIPTTPEQRSAYWSRRKSSKMIENLPLDFDLLAQTHCTGSVQLDSFVCKHRLALSVVGVTWNPPLDYWQFLLIR